MKNLFPGYYTPAEDELSELWSKCVFVFDANVLLNLYSYSDSLRDEFLSLLTFLAESDRLWIPYQVALEYQRNRKDRITKQSDAFNEAINYLAQSGQKLRNFVQQFNKQYRFMEFGEVADIVTNAFSDTKNRLQQQKRV